MMDWKTDQMVFYLSPTAHVPFEHRDEPLTPVTLLCPIRGHGLGQSSYWINKLYLYPPHFYFPSCITDAALWVGDSR